MAAVFCALQYHSSEVATWTQQKRLFIQNNVWDAIIRLDPTQPSNRAGIEDAGRKLRGYDVDAVNGKASVPVAAMFEWADLMVLMQRSSVSHHRVGSELVRRRSLLEQRANMY